MKKTTFFKSYFVTLFLIIFLIIQPTIIIYYLKNEQYHLWELVSSSVLQEGIFADDPQEVTFIYKRKKIISPEHFITLELEPNLLPPAHTKTTQYGDLLRSLSGVFLFGSSTK